MMMECTSITARSGNNAPLTQLLEQYVTSSDERAAVVMSGELADCFENKMRRYLVYCECCQECIPFCTLLRY